MAILRWHDDITIWFQPKTDINESIQLKKENKGWAEYILNEVNDQRCKRSVQNDSKTFGGKKDEKISNKKTELELLNKIFLKNCL